MAHSPEPWKILNGYVVDSNEKIIYGDNDEDMYGYVADFPDTATTERIVACVNACKGVPIKDLLAITEKRKMSERIMELYRIWLPRLQLAMKNKSQTETPE